jgi:hypothetical protein
MPVSYIENGVLYSVSGLLLTLKGMRNKDVVKTIICNQINKVDKNEIHDVDDNARWLIDRIMSLVLIANAAERVEIHEQVAAT